MNRFCFVVIWMVGLLWSLPLHAGEEADKPQKPTFTFAQSEDGDVLLEVTGDARYVFASFIIWETVDHDTGKSLDQWGFDFSIYRPKPHHHTKQKVTNVRSVTLKNVECNIDKREAKIFRSTFEKVTLKFVLTEGPDAEAGEDLFVRGTVLWKKDDGNALTFREAESGRVWRTASLKHDP